VILGDEPVAERAPIVELWVKAARRAGADVQYAGDALEGCRRLADRRGSLGKRLRESERAILIWSSEEGAGGAHLAALARELGFAGKPASGAFHLPQTPNGRGVADAWAAAADDESGTPEEIGLLVVSGDEAAADPNVRALAERAEHVLVTSMFQGLAVGWADLVLPGTSYLERDGTYVNLEGRLQRLRRAAIPPAPDELAWISKLAERFEVEIPPFASAVFAELSKRIYDGLPFGEVGEHAALRTRSEAPPAALPAKPPAPEGDGLRLVRYKALFSGPAVERVSELQFQRPAPEVELSPDDARELGILNGAPVIVSHVGVRKPLRARVNAELRPGVARVANEHAEDMGGLVEVRAAP
jgi:NADH-quinone oxidoreductase subunit G